MGPAAPGRARALGRRTLIHAAASAVCLCAFGRLAEAAPRGERRVALFNPHTTENFDDVYWCDGAYVRSSLSSINWLMRDFHRDAVASIDPTLIDLLHHISQRLDSRHPFRILSGYRTPATNRLLWREGFAPAAHSEHLQARAADICVDRVRLNHLRRAAVSLKGGGVGTYWHENFVHVDVGPVRAW